MSHAAVRHSLQDRRYWLNGQLIERMDARHISNCLRLMVKNPLKQLQASWDRNLRDAPDDAFSEEDLPDGGEEIHWELILRWEWNEAMKMAQGEEVEKPHWFTHGPIQAVRYIASNLEPATIEELNRRADAWVRRQPTYLAMREILVDKIINGQADVVDRSTLKEDFG